MTSYARSLLPLAVLAACGQDPSGPDLGPDYDDPIWSQVDDGKADTSASAQVWQIEWDGFVYVPTSADSAAAQNAVRMQVKSALGGLLHSPALSLRDRDARSNLNPAGFRRQTLRVLSATGADLGSVDRVTYHYKDLALVPRTFTPTTFAVPVLFGDYVARAGELRPLCADDQSTEADSLWFHYDPTRSSCRSAATTELSAINAATSKLPSAQTQLAQADRDRRFASFRAMLSKVTAPQTVYPEYDRLFGFGSDRTKIVAYSFFGVDQDDQNVRDYGLVEQMRFLRTLRATYPNMAVTYTQPQTFILDFTVNGAPLPNVTYDDVTRWMLDGAGWPAAVGNDPAKQADLQRQVRDKFLERWVYFSVPLQATWKGQTRQMTLELRTYYGREDGRPDWRANARNRYLEAFWHADIFSYTGHSHFGHGPLEPVGYSSGNFPNRYQVMLFNSCVSYNYYDIDFLEMHPGHDANLDVVVNGLPAYWPGMGESTARYLLALVDGKGRSWAGVLDGMRVNVAGLPANYEPMRAVTGEQGNAFNPAQGQLTVQVLK